MKLGVVCSLPDYFDVIFKETANYKKENRMDSTYYICKIASKELVLVKLNDASALEQKIQVLQNDFGVDYLMFIGEAEVKLKHLKTGDLMVIKEAILSNNQEVYKAEASMIDACCKIQDEVQADFSCKILVGKLTSVGSKTNLDPEKHVFCISSDGVTEAAVAVHKNVPFVSIKVLIEEENTEISTNEVNKVYNHLYWLTKGLVEKL
ncbi:nucleoside phosphorylase [Desulfitispora alkaliphila]|uniref:hypothetical protein n=1 Tax=Desulfitispora alkaliphila TaxID=622674 RepID=UPI003D24CD57